MNYNESHFPPELNNLIKHKFDYLQKSQLELMDFLKKYLMSTNGITQDYGCENFINLVVKIRFNLDAINVLFPLLYNDYRYKTSINVLYRTIIDDIINICYLFGLVNKAEEMLNSLNNELNILHKEYLKSTKIALEANQKFEALMKKRRGEEPEIVADILESMQKSDPQLFNEKGKWKTNSELRSTTHSKLCEMLDQKKDLVFITEAKKLEFLGKRNFETVESITYLFKYFSQYQHYTPKTHELLKAPSSHDIVAYQRTIGELIFMLNHLFQVIKFKNKEKLELEWKSLADLVFNRFSK